MKIKTVSAGIANQYLGDTIIKCNCAANAVAVYLLPASQCQEELTIKKADSSANAVTVYPNGSDTIDGGASLTLSYENDYYTISPVSGGWTVVDGYSNTNQAFEDPIIDGGTLDPDKLNPVAAAGTLSISGVAIDGETVTIGTDVFEFCADAAQTLTEGSDFAIDITAGATASQGTLTIDTNPTATNTMTIGTTTYTFVAIADFNAAGEIPIGTAVAATQVNTVAAVNGTDGVNTAHALVTMGDFASDDAIITAKIGGVAGDLIATTETFTAGSNIFDAVVLGTTTAGVDCLAPAAVTATVASINANSEVVTAADGAGDTVVVTAVTKGAAGNAIATTETMANGAFGAAALVGGYDAALTTAKLTNPTQAVTINTHSYASGHVAWTLSSTELTKPVHKATLADAGADMVIPLTPSIPYTLINASGQAITVKGVSGNGTAIANAKTATVMSDGTNVIRLTPDA